MDSHGQQSMNMSKNGNVTKTPNVNCNSTGQSSGVLLLPQTQAGRSTIQSMLDDQLLLAQGRPRLGEEQVQQEPLFNTGMMPDGQSPMQKRSFPDCPPGPYQNQYGGLKNLGMLPQMPGFMDHAQLRGSGSGAGGASSASSGQFLQQTGMMPDGQTPMQKRPYTGGPPGTYQNQYGGRQYLGMSPLMSGSGDVRVRGDGSGADSASSASSGQFLQKVGPGQPQQGTVPGQPQQQQQPTQQVIWTGSLEWHDRSRSLPNDQKKTRAVNCHILAQPHANLKMDTWPKQLIMQVIPHKFLVHQQLGSLVKNNKTVLFSFPDKDSDMQSYMALIRCTQKPFAGCVHFPNNGPLNIRVLILLYSVQKLQFVGLIPIDQAAFVNSFRALVTRHKRIHGQSQLPVDLEETIMNGTAPWNRSRIMVIGPAGVGKTSLIRRLTGQKFNPGEKSTKGVEENILTKSAVSSSCWALVDDAQTGRDDLIQSIAMDLDFRSHRPCSTGGEENQSDPEIAVISGSVISGSVISESTLGDAERSVKVLSTSEKEKIAKITQDIPREKITKVKSTELDITYSMWDFGGQEIYYITHPLFLSWRSLYILVFPLHLELSDRAPREEGAENGQKQLKGSAVRTHRTILDLLNFWLMSIYTHAVPDFHLDSTYEPKVLLIGTFAGDKSMQISKEEVESKVQELKVLIGSKPYQKQVLFPICVIDNEFSQRSEVKKIQDRIDGLIKDSEYMKVRKPVKWRTFLTEIEGSDQNTLTVTEARSTMNSLGISDDKVDDVLKFCHDIGHLIYHQGCELIVLKPQFLNSIVIGIITVIDDKKMGGNRAKYQRDLKEKGILSIELIQAVWEEHKGDHDQLNDIIDMMIMFDLICEIPHMPGERRRFFVPCRSSPKLHEKECHDRDHTVEFTIDFHHFLPDGFLHRFYVRMAKWSMERKKSIKPTFHCRQMVFYIDSRHRVEMTNEIKSKERHQIKVMIYAVAPDGASSDREKARVSLDKNIIDYLHETLEDLKKCWARRIEYSVGILCPKCSKYGDKEVIPIRDILKDQDEYACCDDGCPIDVGDILRAFTKGPQVPSVNQRLPSTIKIDSADSSSVIGNTIISQLTNNINWQQNSHGSNDDSLDGRSGKRKKETNRKTDSSDEDERIRGDQQRKIHGSKDDSLGGQLGKRKKMTNRQTPSPNGS